LTLCRRAAHLSTIPKWVVEAFSASSARKSMTRFREIEEINHALGNRFSALRPPAAASIRMRVSKVGDQVVPACQTWVIRFFGNTAPDLGG